MDQTRRRFLSRTAMGVGGWAAADLLVGLKPLSAAEVNSVRSVSGMANDVEPLVRWLEETPQDRLIEEAARRVQGGLGYRQLLAALLLAGVRNVQPRPSVGFKFHAVLVVNSAHLASISCRDQDRWLPIFWAINNFKHSQRQDINEGDWTLSPVDEASVPAAHLAERQLREALDQWDEAKADTAIVSMVRHCGANRIYQVLVDYVARDFRSIGHKVIYLSNAFRTLQTIGWDYAEPVMRSLVYAMLNHNGEPNPADSDLAADRPGRTNREKAKTLPEFFSTGKPDEAATLELIQAIRQFDPQASADQMADLRSRVPTGCLWDALFASAAELLMRQPGIVALHAVTTTNAFYQAFSTASDPETRNYLLLQNASFLSMFGSEAKRRGALAERWIDQWSDIDSPASVVQVFDNLSGDRQMAAGQMYQWLNAGGDPREVIDHARRLVFLKGNDSHDYKFSSAALEDYRVMSPVWSRRYLAASAFQLRGSSEADQPLVQRIRDSLKS